MLDSLFPLLFPHTQDSFFMTLYLKTLLLLLIFFALATIHGIEKKQLNAKRPAFNGTYFRDW